MGLRTEVISKSKHWITGNITDYCILCFTVAPSDEAAYSKGEAMRMSKKKKTK